MKKRQLRSTFCFVMLLPALGATSAAAAPTHFYKFSGKPGSIACTTTSNTLAPGLVVSWNLPEATGVLTDVIVGKAVVHHDVQMPDALSGSVKLEADTTSWTTPVDMPYKVVHSVTPQSPGAGTSTLTFDCVNGKGTNFRISNARPF